MNTIDRDLKREAFDIANTMLKEDKKQRQEDESREQSLYRINYFPFTHGDLIDKQRSVLAELLRNEQL